MTILWLVMGAMLLVALACVIPPLLRPGVNGRGGAREPQRRELAVALYRAQQAEAGQELASGQLSPQQYAEVERELEQRLLDEAKGADDGHDAAVSRARSASPRAELWQRAGMAALLLALLPSAALLLYLKLGNPVAALVQSGEATDQAERHADSPASLDAMVARLAARLARQPDDAQGWSMLARSYIVLARPDDAVVAYQRALALTPEDPALLADYADALVSANGGTFDEFAGMQIHAALALDPMQPKALALAGAMALEQRDYRQAITFWQRLAQVPGVPPEMAAQAGRQIAEMQSLMHKVPGMASVPATAVSPRALEVHVSLSPTLAMQAKPDDTVFVVARAVDGPRMPLAVQRLRLADLPVTVRLDDSMAMTPELRLSAFERVQVEAHVSASGEARPKKGDLLGQSGPLAMDKKIIDVVVNQKVN
ncbi:c-type cytochrome biogenesis protein CcmI [Paraburkholderia hayleyella]|uniref:c-type cytochrome biogenesis protein CcmI n=1 Tax=Paraburkholderia hayleyella TaxID=2152889 RepID=UPI001291E033|nr:c-type cytochrome biogenesis protein CcmI [Paraburkholderia hayleyella]